jgi:predicted PurR-regulated permease PerM
VHWVLGRYLRGQLYLIGIMSVVTYLVLTFGFHLRFAVLIAVLTGVLEVIPLLGPVLAASIASVIALTQGGPGMMIAIIVTYTVLRQLEDQLVMPIVVGRAVHLHPLITIFAVLTGATTAGVLGAVLAVPIAAAIRVTIDYVFVDPKQRAPNADEKVKLGDVPVPEVVIPPTAD